MCYSTIWHIIYKGSLQCSEIREWCPFCAMTQYIAQWMRAICTILLCVCQHMCLRAWLLTNLNIQPWNYGPVLLHNIIFLLTRTQIHYFHTVCFRQLSYKSCRALLHRTQLQPTTSNYLRRWSVTMDYCVVLLLLLKRRRQTVSSPWLLWRLFLSPLRRSLVGLHCMLLKLVGYSEILL